MTTGHIGTLSSSELDRPAWRPALRPLIAVAWAEGIQAAIYVFKEITSPYWLNEKRLQDQKIALIGEKITQAARSRKE